MDWQPLFCKRESKQENGRMGKKTIGRALALVLLLCMLGILAGCGGQANKDKIIYMNNDGKDVFGSFIEAAFDEIARQNKKQVQYLDAQGDLEKQIRQFEEAVKGGAKTIVLQAVDETKIVPAVEKAAAAGVTVIPINRHLQTNKVCGVYPDEYGAGQMQAEYMEQNLPDEANVFYLQGNPSLLSSKLRWEGFRDSCLRKRTDIRLVDSLPANYSRKEAKRIVAEWAKKYPKMDAVVCANDEMALGALAALKEANRAQGCIISGIDATPEALEAIESGEIQQTIKQDAHRQANSVFHLIEALARGEKNHNDVRIPFIPITQENLEQYKK